MRRRMIFICCFFALLTVPIHAQIPAGCPPATPTGRMPVPGYTSSNFNLSKINKQILTRNTAIPLILVFAHRGYWEKCPENSLEAMQSSWDLGSEGVEMDVRLSGSGEDNNQNYPNGEVFLTHDYDLRLEAPNYPVSLGQSSNILLQLSPQQLRARQMVDRYGNLAVDNTPQQAALRLPSFTDLLTSYVARAKTISGGVVPNASPISGYSLVEKGETLVVDIKGQDTGGGTSVSGQYAIFVECLKELNAFQTYNKVDLRQAIAFKVSFKNFTNPPGGSYMPAATLAANIKALGFPYNPNIIFIVYPQDAADCSTTPCEQIQPAAYTTLEDYRLNYSALQTIDWQARNPGNALDIYLTSPEWSARSVAMYIGSNAFAEGFRQNDAICYNKDATTPPNLIDWTICRSDPVIRWGSQDLDYLIPATGSRAELITTDHFLNALSFLNTLDLNNQSLIQ